MRTISAKKKKKDKIAGDEVCEGSKRLRDGVRDTLLSIGWSGKTPEEITIKQRKVKEPS